MSLLHNRNMYNLSKYMPGKIKIVALLILCAERNHTQRKEFRNNKSAPMTFCIEFTGLIILQSLRCRSDMKSRQFINERLIYHRLEEKIELYCRVKPKYRIALCLLLMRAIENSKLLLNSIGKVETFITGIQTKVTAIESS